MLTELENAANPGMFGGKASGLALARSLGLRVPPTTVLAAPALGEGSLRAGRWLESAAEHVVRWADRARVAHLAVRSSAVVEDQASHSYAGIFRSAFTPADPGRVRAAIAEVIESASSPERTAYEEAAGIPRGGNGMAVVIQATVFPVRSGIMFSWGQAPAAQTRIQASWGLAIDLVQGITVGDRYERRPPAAAAVIVGDKPLAIYPVDPLGHASPGDFSAVDFTGDGSREPVASKVVFVDEESGLAYVRVPHDLAGATCLDGALTAELERIASIPVPGYHTGMDVEWSQDVHGRVWVVQLRPVTAPPPTVSQDEEVTPARPPGRGESVLTGEPGAPGTCRGAVSSPASILERSGSPDRVLVCGTARPELMPSVVRAAAIVSSDGGILCHIAIVARELAKPCVIGIQHAESVLREDQVVTVDGTKGKVHLETEDRQAPDAGPAPGPAVEFVLSAEDLGGLLAPEDAGGPLAGDPPHIVLVVLPDVERQLRDRSVTDELLSRFPTLILLFPAERWRAEWEANDEPAQWASLGFTGRLAAGTWQALFRPRDGVPDMTTVLKSLNLEC